MQQLWVTALLVGLLYITFNVIPAGDREAVIEYVTEKFSEGRAIVGVPEGVSDASAVAADVADASVDTPEGAPTGGGIGAFLAGIFKGVDPGTGPAKASGGPVSISNFPQAYNNWSRTDYLDAEAAVLAMRTMDGLLRSDPTELLALEDVSRRVAAIYRDGGASLMIFVEAPAVAPPQMLDEADAGPAPAVLSADGTVGVAPVSVPEPEIITALADRADATDPGEVEAVVEELPTVVLAGISFEDHSGGARGVLDLRTMQRDGLTLILRGRVSRAAAEEVMQNFRIGGFR